MTIRSLKDWCTALDEQSKIVQKYENELTAFYKNLKVKPDYDTPFMTGCYNKENFMLGVLRCLPKSLLITAVSTVIVWIISIIIKMTKMPDGFIDALRYSFGYCVKSTVFIAVISFVLFLGFNILIRFLVYVTQKSSLSKLETQLSDFLTTVPMNYRASDKMKAIAMVYFTKPSIDPSIILLCVDDYLRQAGHTTPYVSVMFDLPCECPFLDLGDSVENNGTAPIIDTKNPSKKKNPYLPQEIDTKVFEGAKDSYKELRDMIGLESVKDQISKFENRVKFYGKNSNNGCHLAFLGSAGTGKTTVARIVTKILYDLGFIQNNQYIEISGDYLCAGDTNRAMAIIEYAYGSVLFIDEAYLMEKRGYDVIGVLLKAMEDHRKDFVCILAGYEEQMTRLFATNEGFTSRVKYSIYFPDYTEDEMIDIFNYFIKDYNKDSYKLSEDAIPLLKETFTLEKRSKSFGNARTVRNAVDAVMDNYADRSIRENTNTHIVSIDDVQLYADSRKKILQHELKNSSAADQVDEQIIRLSELKTRMKNGSEDPDTGFSNMIGLESFKKEIEILKNQKEFYGKTIHQKILLIGEDGCGKSSLTKILTGYLYKLGYITENKYLEISAEFFKGSFVGHTAKRAEAIISYASGGVLYIKNYNSLVNNTDSFSGEVISAITSALNENNDVTIVIGDYESPSIDTIKNLFTLIYEFPTYSNEQLLQIFDMLTMKNGIATSDDLRDTIWNYLNENQCNIRDIQAIYNNTIKQHIINLNGNNTNTYFMTKDDLVLPNINTKLEVNNFKEETINEITNIIETSNNTINNAVELQIEAVPDETSTADKPKIKLSIKPKQ